MKVSAPHRGWTSGRATPSLRPTPMRQRQQTRQDATYRSRKSVQTTAASSQLSANRLGEVSDHLAMGPDRSADIATAVQVQHDPIFGRQFWLNPQRGLVAEVRLDVIDAARF